MASLPEGVTVVFDQAYREFVDDPEYADGLDLLKAGRENVIVLRTFSKAYGLAGMRLGYALVPRARVLAPGHDQGAVQPQPALHRRRPRRPRRHRVAGTAASRRPSPAGRYLTETLTGWGFDVAPSQANFVLVDVGEDAEELWDRLLRRGVIVRPCTGWGLTHHVRVTVGRPRAERALPRGAARRVAGARGPRGQRGRPRAGAGVSAGRRASPRRPSWTCCATCAAGSRRSRSSPRRRTSCATASTRPPTPCPACRSPSSSRAPPPRSRTSCRSAARYRRPVYTRGAGTNLSGGSTPVDGGLVLCLLEMHDDPRDRRREPHRHGAARRHHQGPRRGLRQSTASCTRPTPAPWPSPPWAAASPSAPAACAASSTASPRTTSWASRSCSPTAACCAPAARRSRT